ncbi:hypothetical protein I533_13225 [Alteromonas mediterranea MED64]|uniref:PEP-CTERM domain protein n=1 Tax=Alteromonas mediterranea TaxID=314275 RepID=UPI0003556F12|nr:PEP-CTERM domain protein [Alteromonas mediterranea]AGP82605.1 hypothetical protein I533_13225 [Alteromonas mediterranea MED64]
MRFLKLIATLALPVVSLSSTADEFYIDNGADFDASKNSDVAVDQNTTGWLTELLHKYESNTTALCSAAELAGGCNINTSGGADLTSFAAFMSSLGTNGVTDLSPLDVLDASGPSDNNYSESWGITFSFNVEGTIEGADLVTNYTGGTVNFYYYDLSTVATGNISTAVVELFTVDVFGTSNSPGGQILQGSISSFGSGSINGVAITDFFNVGSGTFASILENQQDLAVNIDYNTDSNLVTINDNGDGTTSLSGTHDGSVSFAVVPEPFSVALFGLSLFVISAFSRKKAIK